MHSTITLLAQLYSHNGRFLPSYTQYTTMMSIQHHAATHTAGGYRVRPRFQVAWYTEVVQHDSVTCCVTGLSANLPRPANSLLGASQTAWHVIWLTDCPWHPGAVLLSSMETAICSGCRHTTVYSLVQADALHCSRCAQCKFCSCLYVILRHLHALSVVHTLIYYTRYLTIEERRLSWPIICTCEASETR